jgi:hypothetical protein
VAVDLALLSVGAFPLVAAGMWRLPWMDQVYLLATVLSSLLEVALM